jgi:AraC-like DNA-binding protein
MSTERVATPGPGMISFMLALSGDITILGEGTDEWRIPANTAAVMFRPSDSVFDLVARYGARLMVLTLHISIPALSHEPFRSGLGDIVDLLRPVHERGHLLGTMPITRKLRSLALEASALCRGLTPNQPLRQAIQTLELLEGIAHAHVRDGTFSVPIPAKGDLEKLFQVKARIDGEFANPLKLTEVASDVAMTPSRLTQAFQAAFGLSPMAYLNRVRLDRAMDMLRGTDATIGQIAWAVGYSHQGNFTVAFKRATGMSPRLFRSDALPPGRHSA